MVTLLSTVLKTLSGSAGSGRILRLLLLMMPLAEDLGNPQFLRLCRFLVDNLQFLFGLQLLQFLQGLSTR